jgi:hypothetical protein
MTEIRDFSINQEESMRGLIAKLFITVLALGTAMSMSGTAAYAVPPDEAPTPVQRATPQHNATRSVNEHNATRTVNPRTNPSPASALTIGGARYCTPPDFWDGHACVHFHNLTYDQVAPLHTTIMQAYIINYSAIRARTGSHASVRTTLMAMLQVNGVSLAAKTAVKQALALPQAPPMTDACRSLVAGVKNRLPSNPETPQQLAQYLKSRAPNQPSCSGFLPTMQAAVAIVQQGESTIYNPTWLAQHSGGGPPSGSSGMAKWKKILLADLLGALGGCCTPAGAAFGGIAGSLGALLPQD